MKSQIKTLLVGFYLLFSLLSTAESEFKVYQNNQSNHEVYSDGLTDEEIKISNEYVHEGYKERAYEELCKDNEDECKGNATYLLGATGDTIIESASKMMGVFGFMSKFSYTGPAGATNSVNAGKSKTETKEANDYCAFIPMGGEMIAQFQQTTGQKAIMNTPTSEGNEQRDALMKAVRAHDKRAETATIQAGVWGITTGCYTALTVKHAMSGNVMSWTKGQIANHAIKIAASAGLTAFYWLKRKKALEAKETTLEISKKLGKISNCNPITETDCYCAQTETKKDPKYCLPQELKKRANSPATVTTCIDRNMKTDPNCNCLSSGGCYDALFDKANFKVVQNDPIFSKGELSPIKSLFRGQLKSSLTPKWSGGILRAAHNRLNEIDPPEIPSRLTKEQKKRADVFKDLGLNSNWSNYFATKPATPEEKKIMEQMKSRELGRGRGYYYTSEKSGRQNSRSSILRFKNGPRKFKKAEEKNPFDLFNKFNQKKKRKKPTGQILRFAKKAENQATVHLDQEKSIFEIIENSYRKQWKNFNK